MEQLSHQITSHADLRKRIAYLESIKDNQEEVLRKNIHEVYKSLQPAELLKSAIENISNDEEIGKNAASLAGNAGIDLLTAKMFDNNRSFGGKLKALAISQALKFIYHRNEDKVHDFIGNLTHKVADFLNFSDRKKK